MRNGALEMLVIIIIIIIISETLFCKRVTIKNSYLNSFEGQSAVDNYIAAIQDRPFCECDVSRAMLIPFVC